jgi:hypothetical protein
MNLTEIEVLGNTVQVEVGEDGTFRASLNPELELEAESLGRLKGLIRDSIIGSRVEVPFVNDYGARGVMRGFHAQNQDILVTWDDGEKGRISPHTRVFKTMGDETVAEIRSLEGTVRQAQERLAEIRKPGLQAQDVFVEGLSEDVFDWRRHEATA